jgi:hypothetical protein
VTHACNPSYSGGRDQEDLYLKPDWTNSMRGVSHTIWLVEWSRCRPWVQPPPHKKLYTDFPHWIKNMHMWECAWWCTTVILETQEVEERTVVQGQTRKKWKTQSETQTKSKRMGSGSVVENLPGKCEALSSTRSTSTATKKVRVCTSR